MIPLSPTLDLVNAAVNGSCAWFLWRSYHLSQQAGHSSTPFIRSFAAAFLYLTIAYLWYSLPLLIAPNNHNLGELSFVLANLFILFGSSRIAAIAIAIRFKTNIKIERSGWLLFCCLNMFVALVLLLFPSYSIFNPDNGLSTWVIPLPVAVTLASLYGIYLAIIIGFYTWTGTRSTRKSLQRRRSILLVTAAIILLAANILYFVANTITAAIIADSLFVVGFLVVFASVVIRSIHTQPKTALQTGSVKRGKSGL